MPHSHSRSRSVAVSSISLMWFLASAVSLFALENIWLDPWLRSKSRDIPSLAPEPLSGFWFLALLVVALVCAFLVVAWVLVAKDRRIPLMKRIGTGLATLIALVLCVLWVHATGGESAAPPLWQEAKGHTVTLTWKASKSAVRGYNVYRATSSGGPYTKINSELVRDLTYKDQNVQNGKTYYYITRSVDADARESVNSSEIAVTVP